MISLCAADEGARRFRARQKISKIRRPTRGTVHRAIRCRIYKERRRDLCRAVGYLSVSMAHAISLHGYRYVLSTSEAESPPPLFLLSSPPSSSHISCFIIGSFSFSFSLSLSFRRDLIYLRDTCGVDPVNTTSSIVKAKRLGLPSGSTAGISCAEAAKKSRHSCKNIRKREDT